MPARLIRFRILHLISPLAPLPTEYTGDNALDPFAFRAFLFREPVGYFVADLEVFVEGFKGGVGGGSGGGAGEFGVPGERGGRWGGGGEEEGVAGGGVVFAFGAVARGDCGERGVLARGATIEVGGRRGEEIKT